MYLPGTFVADKGAIVDAPLTDPLAAHPRLVGRLLFKCDVLVPGSALPPCSREYYHVHRRVLRSAPFYRLLCSHVRLRLCVTAAVVAQEHGCMFCRCTVSWSYEPKVQTVQYSHLYLHHTTRYYCLY